MFIFMGFLTEQAGLMERLFQALRQLLAPVRGSLYLVVILTSTIFAMATGIVGAVVTVLGIMAGPIMIKSGYDHWLSAGAIAAGGTLGTLIPPSVMLIVMGPVLGVCGQPVCSRFWTRISSRFALHRVPACAQLPKSLGPPVPLDERTGSFALIIKEIIVGTLPLIGLITAALGRF
jgi:TRAP-type mannitol/chloroaromatic compound transport system permease large subunit